MQSGSNCMQEHALPEDEDESLPDALDAGNAEELASMPSESPDMQSATSPSGRGLQVQWRWSLEGHPEQGVTCMAWNQVYTRSWFPIQIILPECLLQ